MSSNCFSNLKYDGIAYQKRFHGVTIEFFIWGQKNCSARPRGAGPSQYIVHKLKWFKMLIAVHEGFVH